MNKHRVEVFFEFLVFGIVIGVVEDLIAIRVATNAVITSEVILVVVLVAIPFAFLGEVLVDRVDFISLFEKLKEKYLIKNNKKQER